MVSNLIHSFLIDMWELFKIGMGMIVACYVVPAAWLLLMWLVRKFLDLFGVRLGVIEEMFRYISPRKNEE